MKAKPGAYSGVSAIPADAYAMIIGAMKCGTVSLYRYLASHPEICPCAKKEPEFFSDHQTHRLNEVSKYEDLWKFDGRQHRFALEASTGYTKYPEEVDIPQKIFEYGLRPKFIYIVRNPFDRIRSHYEHLRAFFPGFDSSTPLTADTFVNTSNYALQLDQYRRFFSREDMLILDFDDLSRRPQDCVLRVYRFLGLSDVDLPTQYPVHHQTAAPGEIFLAQRPGLRSIGQLLPKRARKAGRLALQHLLKKRSWKSREREIVFERLSKDMYRFQAEYGFDVSKWGWM
jgi:hypothetical protein